MATDAPVGPGSDGPGSHAHVLLVHGLGRTPGSLASLGRALRREGYPVHQLGYVAAVESVDRIIGRVRDRLEELSAAQVPLVVIGHSLGGILVRAALAEADTRPIRVDHLIMLGPPNRPPRLARRLQRNWLYRIVNGDAGQRLADPGFLDSLPPLAIPHTIIAGTGGPTGRWSPFGGDPNDMIVAVDETHCTIEDPVIQLPVRHTFMMNDPRVRAEILAVLAEIGLPLPDLPLDVGRV